MVAPIERRRVLLAAGPPEAAPLHGLFAGPPLDAWEVLPADSFVHARFLLQHEPCDALLVDEDLYRRERGEGLDWLAAQREAPVVFLAGPVPETVTGALQHGIDHWLPRNLALRYPALLEATLDQVLRASELRRRVRRAGEALHQCRRQISRLVSLLWETAPLNPRTSWFTQRHMMERLTEEVARAGRQGMPFAVALGEVQPGPVETTTPLDPHWLASWSAEQIVRVKRRADVAGRYGPQGFMLLLVQTPEPGARTGCHRLRTALEQAARDVLGPNSAIQVHFGVASYSSEASNPKSLLGWAERRLEEAKASPQASFTAD